MKRHILIICYHFPPIRSAAVARIVGIAKFLRHHGWQVSAITVDRSRATLSDPETLSWIPEDVTIERTRYFDPISMLGRRRGPAEKARAAEAISAARPTIIGRIKNLLKAPAYVVFNILMFPDRNIGWFLPLFFRAFSVIRARRPDVVLTSSPPNSSHLPIALLTYFIDFEWVADFRDCWTAPVYPAHPSRLRLFLSRPLESWILRRCSRIICNTPGNKRELLETFTFLDHKKVTVVTNGFDVSQPVTECVIENDEIDCDMIYFGSVYPDAMRLLIEALTIAKSTSPDKLPRIFVYGEVEESDLILLKSRGLQENVVFKGFVSWDKSLRLMRSSPSLLILLPHTPGGATTVPSKLYSYLFARRPILAIGPDGDAAAVIARVGAGTTISDADPAKVARALVSYLDSVKAGIYEADNWDQDVVRQYAMSEVVSRLNTVLEDQIAAPTLPR